MAGFDALNFDNQWLVLGDRRQTFKPAIPELGLYDLYLWYPTHYGSYAHYNNPATRLTINSAMGVAYRVLNQRNNVGEWVHVGRYIFNAGDDPTESARPWLSISTPQNPEDPNQSSYNYWFYYNEGYFLADGVLFLQDGENLDTDGDYVADWFEYLTGTSTAGNDWDGDGIPDGNGNDDYFSLAEVYHPHIGLPILTVTHPAGATLY